MSELSTVARKLVEEAKALNAEIAVFDDPPSRTQIAPPFVGPPLRASSELHEGRRIIMTGAR